MLDRPDTWKPLSGIAELDFSGINHATGITGGTAALVSDLVDEYRSHAGHNDMLRRYYDGNVRVGDYGVTADIPNDQTCHWPEKAVTALSERITLEGIETRPESDRATLDSVLERNNFISNYNRHVPVKLIYGCMAATVNRDASGHALVRFHSAETFTALPSPDFTDGVVSAGLAIARRERTPWSSGKLVPTVVNLHEPHNVGEFRQVAAGEWVYSAGPTPEELPTLYVFAHNGTGTLAPFGKTRITQFVRTLTDDAIRCLWHMQISGAFYSMAKLYMVGLTDEQFDSVMENKSKYQLSRILAMTSGQDGEHPQVGQLSGNSPQPFIDELRALACQFSGATGVPLNSLGIVQDNPSSAEAISASREDIALTAERDIEADKGTLRRVLRAALAVEGNTTTDRLTDEQADIRPRFASPMLYSLASRADWATKVNSVRPGFGETDVAARMMGIDDADLESVKSDEAKAASNAAIAAIFGGGDDADSA